MPASPTRSTWTDQLVERLKQLWAHGWSASEIGNTLGLSKNAVIGKAHRLQLEQRRFSMKNAVRKGERMLKKRPPTPRLMSRSSSS